jgi:hypothetical protein
MNIARGTWTLLAAAALMMAVVSAPVRVSAWGAQGHHVVARVAWEFMTPAARAEASALLGGPLETFVAASTWADEVRANRPDTYNWHFVDIPLGQRYDAVRDCAPSPKGDCIVAEIARARRDLVRAEASAESRAEALKYLIHFLGDIHQPLHAIDNHDRGGNDVHVTALRGDDGRATNLHAAWDTGLINLADETETVRANRLVADLRVHSAPASLEPAAWAQESHDAADRVAYHYPGFLASGPTAEYVTLDPGYRKDALEAIDRQLALGGGRLAALLNAVFPARDR